jgi:hypothetical protein
MNDSRIPETVLNAISNGTHIIRAYREHLGYSIEDLAVACGLAAEEIENIEFQWDAHYSRIPGALGLFDRGLGRRLRACRRGN